MIETTSKTGIYIGVSLVISAAVALLAITFVVLLLRHLRNSRQLRHIEQMRALELGQPMDPPDPNELDQKYAHNAFWNAFWMVVAVPSASFSGAVSALANTGNSFALGLIIWIFAGLASIAAVVCATVLVMNSRRRADYFGPINVPRAKGMG